MAKPKKFKMNPFLFFYPNDWLNDNSVRRLPAEIKGFYIDLICYLHSCFPYGYCSVINPKKTKKLRNQVNQDDDQDGNLRVELLISLSLQDQLKIAQNVEDELHLNLPHKSEAIAVYIRELEDRDIISRSTVGIIYVRRMKKDFRRRVVAYLNGSQGGNPGVKRGKSGPKTIKNKVDKYIKDNDLQNSVNLKENLQDNQSPDTYNSINNIGREGLGPGEILEKKVIVFQMQELYDKSFSDLQKIHYSKILTEEGFATWKKFVDKVVEIGAEELFLTKFINPPDFQTMAKKEGFVEEKWEPIIRAMLGSGVSANQNLLWRIPQFLGYAKKSVNNKKDGAKGVIATKDRDYSKLVGIKMKS